MHIFDFLKLTTCSHQLTQGQMIFGFVLTKKIIRVPFACPIFQFVNFQSFEESLDPLKIYSYIPTKILQGSPLTPFQMTKRKIFEKFFFSSNKYVLITNKVKKVDLERKKKFPKNFIRVPPYTFLSFGKR